MNVFKSLPEFLLPGEYVKVEGHYKVALYVDHEAESDRMFDDPVNARYILEVSDLEGDGEPLWDDFHEETVDYLRENMNAWYKAHVGYSPDEDNGRELPLGQLIELIAGMLVEQETTRQGA